MSEHILEMNHITKEFSGVKALDDVNIKVKRGEIHALCGENGAGKSTLMNVLSGVYPFGSYSGDIVYNGNVCQFHSIKQSEAKGIVIIHQELALSPYMSVAENVFLGNEQKAAKGIIDWTLTHKKAQEMLEKVGLGGENLNAPISSLGVGKQQLIEIAKAMAKKVELLILDEPTAALNDEESRRLLDRIIKGMVGRELTNRYPERRCEIGDTIFEIKDWNVYHPDDTQRQIIKDVSLHVRKGEVVGLAGLMGAGRTELAMSIFGRSYGQKISGTIKINGREVHIKDVKDAINNKLAYVSEDRKNYGLVLIKDIKWNMTLSAMRNFFSKNGVLNENDEILAAEDYKKKINIKSNSINQTVGSLSGGNQQKVVLAKWMLTQPDVLILDEPTRGIDVGAKYEIYCVINELAKSGKAVIVISSELQEVIGTCDRVYVINEGRIAGELTKEEVTQERIMKCIMADNGKEA